MSSPHARFKVGEFEHNARLVAALLPSLVALCAFGGSSFTSTLIVGSMLSYILDTASLREAALSAIWLTCLGAAFTSFVVHTTSHQWVVLRVVMMVMTGSVMLLAGCWATIQFRWVQMKSPGFVVALERLLFALLLPAAAGCVGWASLLAAGPVAGPFYLMVVLCALFYLLSRPAPSSFRDSGQGRAIGGVPAAQAAVQAPVDGAVHAAVVALAPGGTYAACHWVVLHHSEHFWAATLLFSSSLLFISLCPDGLWWVPSSLAMRRGLQRLVALAAGLLAVLAVEVRVVFYAFSSYIHLPAPWSWIFLSVALYACMALLILHMLGLLGQVVDITVASVVLVLAAAAGGLLLGLPITVLPFTLGAAAGLALFYDSGHLMYYLMFVVGAFVSAAYFIWSNFWFLEIGLASGMTVHTVCKLVAAGFVPALLVPGLMATGTNRPIADLLLIFQGLLVGVVEEQLYLGDTPDGGHGDEPMYPAFLVLATSGIGLAAVQVLTPPQSGTAAAGAAAVSSQQTAGVPASRGGLLVDEDGRSSSPSVHRVTSWALRCIYVSKLALLVLPHARLLLPVLFYTLAVTPPWFLYHTPGVGARSRMKPWVGWLHATSVAAAVAYGRFAVFDIVQWLSSGQPSEGCLLGGLALTLAAGLMPLALKCFPHSLDARRALSLLLALGGLLVVLRPPVPLRVTGAACPKLPFRLCPRLWDERHVPAHEVDDAAMYGAGVARAEHWALWLLLAAALLGISAAAGPPGAAPARARTPAGLSGPRLVAALGSGALTGAYLALEFFPQQLVLQALVVASSLLVAVCLTMLRAGAAAAGPTGSLALLLLAWWVSLPLAMLMLEELPPPRLPQSIVRLYGDISLQAEREVAEARRTALLMVYSVQALLLALAVKLAVSAAAQLDAAAAGSRRGAADGHAGGAKSAGGSRPTYEQDLRRAYAAYSRYGGGGGSPKKGMAQSNLARFACMLPSSAAGALGRMMGLQSASSATMRELQARGWLPLAGNIAACTCLVLGLVLNQHLFQGSDLGVVVLAPLLLLLNRDALLLSALDDRKRYFPPCLVICIGLQLSTLLQVAEWTLASPEFQGGSRWLQLLRSAGLALLPVPNLVSFLTYLWLWKQQSGWSLALTSPPCVLSLVFAEQFSTQLLAGGALLGAGLQYLSMRGVRKRGMKLI